jgi:dimethylglycine dehydrogenase
VTYVGELGWEIHAPIGRACPAYTAIWAAGAPHGIADFGVQAVNSLRMEKGYRGYGAELTNEITLIEADCTRFLRLRARATFRGRAATLAVQAKGITALAGLWRDCRHRLRRIYGGEAVMQGTSVVGVCTSGSYGHATGKSLTFAYVEPRCPYGP